MKLMGMMDSPFVRRTAIGLDLLGILFEHEAVSVFSHFERFTSLNPIVKAPTLFFEDGSYMMDSSLILEYFESQSKETLWSSDPDERRHEARVVSYGLAAIEKSVQAVYERNLRPKDKQHGPWLTRISGQRDAAFWAIESEIARAPNRFASVSHASIVCAIALQFAQSELSAQVLPAAYPHLHAHAERMAALPVFKKFPPVGPGVQA